jgi:hypothetical protein
MPMKCPFCGETYAGKSPAPLYEHIDREHPAEVQGMSAAQAVFNRRNRTSGACCIVCRQPTKFNPASGRYERICDRAGTGCREKYRQNFLERMRRVHGKDHLLDDPEQQKRMLAERRISGEYQWSDGKTRTVYTGTYERDFLEFLDHFLDWEPSDVAAPAPQVIPYVGPDGKAHSYIPDFWIPSMDLMVEVKASSAPGGAERPNMHAWRSGENAKEKAKDDAVRASGIKYVKVVDKDYSGFVSEAVRSKEAENGKL